MEEITPGQKEQLSNWSIQRDALLGEIATLNIEKEKLSKENTAIAISSEDIAKRIEQSKGRLEELDNTEKLYMEIVDSKLPELESQKALLTSQNETLLKTISESKLVYTHLKEDIEFLMKVQSEVFNRTEILDKVVEHVTNVSSSNIKDLETSIISITNKAKEIIALSDVNITAHTEILNEIPKLFVELSRKTLTRQKI